MTRSDSLVIYTDGACSGNPGRGGWAFVALSPDDSVFEAGGGSLSTTNNRMEMTAALEGLRFAGTLGAHLPSSVQIFTDSVYLIRGATQWIHGWRKREWKTAEGDDVSNRDLWEQIAEAMSPFSRTQLKWHFIRGHRGIAGNERCDEIAVAFSKGVKPHLYHGDLAGYGRPIEELPKPEALPDLSNRSAPAKPYSYVSVVDGILKTHKTWAECEMRVKGRRGAKFKKVMSADEESSLIREWGF